MSIKVFIEDLPKTSQTPILTYCRKLMKAGFDPSTSVEFFRKGKTEYDVIVYKIGEAAKLGVAEEPACRFVKYDPPSAVEASKKLGR